jgi:hypothetical protein
MQQVARQRVQDIPRNDTNFAELYRPVFVRGNQARTSRVRPGTLGYANEAGAVEHGVLQHWRREGVVDHHGHAAGVFHQTFDIDGGERGIGRRFR